MINIISLSPDTTYVTNCQSQNKTRELVCDTGVQENDVEQNANGGNAAGSLRQDLKLNAGDVEFVDCRRFGEEIAGS